MAESFDYDVAIVGCGVGGHGAALHARAQGLTTCVLSGGDVGGTCVNRGCVPSKALLAASNRVREMGDADHLKAMGITAPGGVAYDRAGVAAHAAQLVSKVRGGLEGSLKGLGVDVIEAFGAYKEPHTLDLGDGRTLTAKDIILAPGSVPFVPPGVEIDGETVYTSDEGLDLAHVPEYCAIIGSGIIGLEFSDVYTALGAECTLIEALPELMPAFDREIAKQAERLLLAPRGVDYRTNVFASKVTPGKLGERPVVIEMIDATTKELVEVLEVDTCMVATGRKPNTARLGLEAAGIDAPRGFVQVDDRMRVLDKPDGAVVPHLYCIGDANGIQMLAHTASTQGISAVENICGRVHVVDHESIPAACFTHPEVAQVGLDEAAATARADAEGFELGKAVSHFRANSKALAEGEGDGIAKVLFNKDTEQILGVHIIGLHAADLIQECANAKAAKISVRDLAFTTHTHPTLSEVVDGAFKACVGMNAH
jgi:dihydrolipoamide dehydrogenase